MNISTAKFSNLADQFTLTMHSQHHTLNPKPLYFPTNKATAQRRQPKTAY